MYKKIKLDLDDICNSGDLEDVVVEKVKKFFDYFQKQWIYSNILLSSLCKYRKSCRSTNVAESFHSTVKKFGDRKSTRLNSSHRIASRMPSSA